MIIANTLTQTELAFILRVLAATKCSSSKTEALRIACTDKVAQMQLRLEAESAAHRKLVESRAEAERTGAVYTYPMQARGYKSPQLRKSTPPRIFPENAEVSRLASLSTDELLAELDI